jgi:micrococcal nuclease
MYEYRAKLIRVVDGDTVDLEIDLGFSMTCRDRFRLNGIDTPERGKPGYEAAKCRLREFLECCSTIENILVVTEKAKEKYGRYLADIYVTPISQECLVHVNRALVEEGLAKPYDGGHKDEGSAANSL